MYPIKFKPILKKKVWGGNRLDSILDVESTDKCKYGEAWVVCAHDNGMATVSNGSLSGKTLEEVLVEYGSAILGDNNYGEGFGLFPLLIKFLDIKDKLSVQVHPSAEYASNNNMVSGKFESWYILDASDDAAIILGKNNQITDEDFGIKIRNKNISNLFNIVDVKKGDFIDINPGLLHGTIKGEILLCEIQQNSDITYRLYDFDRLYEGKKRDLHLSHLGAVDSSIIPYISSENNRLVEKVDNVSLERLTSNSHYSVNKVTISNGTFSIPAHKSFIIISIISGEGSLKYNTSISTDIFSWDTYLIPANLEVEIHGNLEFLEIYI